MGAIHLLNHIWSAPFLPWGFAAAFLALAFALPLGYRKRLRGLLTLCGIVISAQAS